MSVRDFQERKKMSRVLYSWPVLIMLIILLVTVFGGIWRAYRGLLVLWQETALLQKNIARAHAERVAYEQKTKELQMPQRFDYEARSRFNVKKPGEEVVIFVDQPPTPKAEESGAASVWRAFTGWLGNIF